MHTQYGSRHQIPHLRIPLQPVLIKEEIKLLSSLIPLPASSDLPPLQAVQYRLLRKWFDKGEIGVPVALCRRPGSIPSPDTSYATPIVFHLVRVVHLHFVSRFAFAKIPSQCFVVSCCARRRGKPLPTYPVLCRNDVQRKTWRTKKMT